jgi:hypothetical protein
LLCLTSRDLRTPPAQLKYGAFAPVTAALEKVLAERHELQLVVARVEGFAQRLRKG